ncbi:MAG: hypothetical protein HC799_19615 [Limnothrix sp. RL_2_0]|nr:hypothetical protein [Limnothrix sp. RL_2_0]
MIAGGVSSGVFRSLDGGRNWTKVSSNSEIHNCTTIAQDPRPGFQNIWYYGTGEWSGNSASLGSPYRGQGVWKSINNGVTWSQISETNSVFTSFDSPFDYVNKIEVSPVNGHIFMAVAGRIYRYDGNRLSLELSLPGNSTAWTDVEITTNGRVIATIEGSVAEAGVFTSPTGSGNWTKLNDPNPAGWNAQGRIVLGIAPSNPNVFYALYDNNKTAGANGGDKEADLWKYDLSTSTWTDFSAKLPDEPGGNSSGNDPFAIQGAYDLVVAVKPDDENYVFIGGTNAYEITNINTETMFARIGGYKNNQGYALYDAGGIEHHPDIHSFTFDPQNPDIMYSGTDGGVHKYLYQIF